MKTEFKLFNTEIKVFTGNNISKEYINKCIEHLNNLSEEVLSKLCQGTINFCNDYRDVITEENVDIPESIKDKEILKYIHPNSIVIEEEKENSIGYVVEFNCDWETEHGMAWSIRDNNAVYVGMYNVIDPWNDNEYGNYLTGFSSSYQVSDKSNNNYNRVNTKNTVNVVKNRSKVKDYAKLIIFLLCSILVFAMLLSYGIKNNSIVHIIIGVIFFIPGIFIISYSLISEIILKCRKRKKRLH